jgi:hypothetical protein
MTECIVCGGKRWVTAAWYGSEDPDEEAPCPRCEPRAHNDGLRRTLAKDREHGMRWWQEPDPCDDLTAEAEKLGMYPATQPERPDNEGR